MSKDVILLGEVADRLPMLEVACNRCDRKGSLRTDKLLAEHGALMGVPTLRRLIAADCPKWTSHSIADQCGVHFPGLVAVFR